MRCASAIAAAFVKSLEQVEHHPRMLLGDLAPHHHAVMIG